MIADGGKRGCLGDESVLRFLHRELLLTEDARVHAHIAACANCRRIVAEASRMFFEDEAEAVPPRPRADYAFPEDPLEASDEGDWPARILPPGTHVSRYVVRRLIGAGAGGTVYEAHDPQLGRPVALKLVRQPPDQRVRRVPEEQALAKLSHPNVVNVYDTGVFESLTFVVMEMVVGTSARDWLEEQPRSWREVVQVFLEAGRGLAASHAVGLVHRDFKPENVIVGTDGRARVTDFGLARALIHRALPEEETAASSKGAAAELGASSIAGTPAYMAPEQFRGRRADERSDQFSFCVSLYRALYRQPPFSKRAERTDPAVFAREVLSGRVRPPPPDTAVPVWLDRLIRRGLRTNPAERFPSMEALLSEIGGGLGPSAAPAPPLRSLPRLLPLLLAGTVIALLAIGAFRSGGDKVTGVASSRCGNGLVERGEGCDDGNRAADDACLPDCRSATCGDGALRRGVEECDDGNQVEGDGCSSRCLHCTEGDAQLMWEGNGRCYTRHDQPLSWQQAEEACQAIGSHLATFNVWAELRDVHDRLLRGRSTGYWIGFADRSSSGEYGWTTGEATNRLLPWASQDAPPGQCGLYDSRRNPALVQKPWMAEPCSSTHGFMCEKEEARIWPAQNYAYRAVDFAGTFVEAREVCRRLGAHLLTISSLEENAFVSSQFFGVKWLGAESVQQPRDFRWVDGEPFKFRLFAPAEPDRIVMPNCLVLGEDRMWHDRACDGQGGGPYGVVCEFE